MGRRLVAVLVVLLSAPAIFAQGLITTVTGRSWSFVGEGPLAVNSPLGQVSAVAVDPLGNVFAADIENAIVVKISAAGVLTVVAGNGTRSFLGDGGLAREAALADPRALALDRLGNLYITDGGRVRKVSPDGLITTVAGIGVPGFSGDGGPAANVQLDSPQGITVDEAGNLYIADANNHRIRKVSPNGIITTVAGSGDRFFFGGFAGDGGLATNAQMNSPREITLDGAGNLYIADFNNNRIRKVSPAGIITTVRSLESPKGIAVDGAGNLYITPAGSHRIFNIGLDGGVVAVAGTGTGGFSGDGGPATRASLNSPAGVAVDSLGNLYIADTMNSRIRRVGRDGIITTVAGNGLYKFGGDGGEAQSARLNSPQGVAVDARGNLYIADSNNNRVRSITAGIINTFAGSGVYGFSGDGGAATSALLRHPAGVAVDGVASAFNLYIADSESNRIRKVNPNLILTTALAGVEFPSGVAVDAAGNLFLAETGKSIIRKFGLDGSTNTVAGNGSAGFAGDGGPATLASLHGPLGVALDRVGNLYIADTGNHRVRKVDVGGRITTVAGNGVADYSGEGERATGASLNFPSGVAVDSRGLLYIADRANHRVRRVNPDGRIATVAGNGERGISGDGGAATLAALNTPIGLAFDEANNLYIADTGNDRIRQVVTFPPSDVPVFAARAVTNGASFVSGATPGGIVTIFGTGLTKGVNGVVSAAGIPLPTELRGTRVKVNQIYAPLFSVSNVEGQEQINLQLPFEYEGQSAVTLTVENNGVIGSPIRIKLQGVLPGVFTLEGQTGAILHGASSQFVLPSNPAARNEIVILYATGLGPVNRTPATGAPASASPLSLTVFSPAVTVGGINAEVLFSGLAPGFVGLYQVNIRVPANAPSGNVDVVIQSGGETSKAVKMAVQ